MQVHVHLFTIGSHLQLNGVQPRETIQQLRTHGPIWMWAANAWLFTRELKEHL